MHTDKVIRQRIDSSKNFHFWCDRISIRHRCRLHSRHNLQRMLVYSLSLPRVYIFEYSISILILIYNMYAVSYVDDVMKFRATYII